MMGRRRRIFFGKETRMIVRKMAYFWLAGRVQSIDGMRTTRNIWSGITIPVVPLKVVSSNLYIW